MFSTMAWVRLRLADGVQASETGRRRWRVRQRAPGAATRDVMRGWVVAGASALVLHHAVLRLSSLHLALGQRTAPNDLLLGTP